MPFTATIQVISACLINRPRINYTHKPQFFVEVATGGGTFVTRRSESFDWHEYLGHEFALSADATIGFKLYTQSRILRTKKRLGRIDLGREDLAEIRRRNHGHYQLTLHSSDAIVMPLGFLLIAISHSGIGTSQHQPALERALALPMVYDEDPKSGLREVLAKLGGLALNIHLFALQTQNVAYVAQIFVERVLEAFHDLPDHELADQSMTAMIFRMNLAYNFIESVKHIEDVGTKVSLDDIVVSILRQTVECTLFIRDYYGVAFTGHDLHKDIVVWLFKPGSPVLWLYGTGGCGKTTYAATLADFLRAQGRLGASIFFTPDAPAMSSPALVIRSIAAQLSSFDPRIGSHIAQLLQDDLSILDAPLSVQISALIIEPLSSIESLGTEGPIFVILDGLDHCGNMDTRKGLLCALKSRMADMPSSLQLFIISRRNNDIEHALISAARYRFSPKGVLGEFFKAKVSQIQMRSSAESQAPLSLPDVASQYIRATLQRWAQDSGSYLWTSMAYEFAEKQLDTWGSFAELAAKEPLTLDQLFSLALTKAGDWKSRSVVSDYHSVFGAILSAETPLTSSAINALADWESGQSVQIHPSFRDFITNPRRCSNSPGESWFIDVGFHRGEMAIRSSNGSISDFRAWSSEIMEHSCLYWVDYFQQRGVPDSALLRFLLYDIGDWFTVTAVNARRHLEILDCLLQIRVYHSPPSDTPESILKAGLDIVQAYAALSCRLPPFPAGRLESRLLLDHDGVQTEDVDDVVKAFVKDYFGESEVDLNEKSNEIRSCVQHVADSVADLRRLLDSKPEYGWENKDSDSNTGSGWSYTQELNRQYLYYARDAALQRHMYTDMAKVLTQSVDDDFSDDGRSFRSREFDSEGDGDISD
ncbi:hypothetical protein EUX98_g8469 [Antrodiella citrinella]|uniref:Nephrocystin 3-like N-terminal domain-containing protein n=1 Tax=Antrodiella citrinella TaxID=2447956 RepID=A0A4S4M8E9_9APHY|nr:hypothetical protein EUX98_g8469 [Antrodiella citrinella]